MRVDNLGRSIKVVDSQGRATQELSLFFEAVSKLPVLIGTGLPENVIEASQGSLYLNESGAPGSVLYVKRLENIGGDRSQGWTAV